MLKPTCNVEQPEAQEAAPSGVNERESPVATSLQTLNLKRRKLGQQTAIDPRRKLLNVSDQYAFR
eukprot:4434723-Pyramimonas_sp.AAC.1